MTPTGQVTVIHRFSNTDGVSPRHLIEGSDFALYGVTASGGTSGGEPGTGEVFKLSGVISSTPPNANNGDGPMPLWAYAILAAGLWWIISRPYRPWQS